MLPSIAVHFVVESAPDFSGNPFNGGPAFGPNVRNINLTGKSFSQGPVTHNNIIESVTRDSGMKGIINEAQ